MKSPSERNISAMEMTEMMNLVEKFSASDYYTIGFIYKHMIYAYDTEKLNPAWLSFEKASRNVGMSVRLRVRTQYKMEMLRNGAICVGEESDLESNKYNKGEMFEKIITERNGNTWAKDHVGFWICGDTKVNGKEVQIKFDGATITNNSIISKLAQKNA